MELSGFVVSERAAATALKVGKHAFREQLVFDQARISIKDAKCPQAAPIPACIDQVVDQHDVHRLTCNRYRTRDCQIGTVWLYPSGWVIVAEDDSRCAGLTVANEPTDTSYVLVAFSLRESLMSNERELIDTGNDKRYTRRNDDGTLKESDDQGESLSADVKQDAKSKKPRNEGDKGDQLERAGFLIRR